MCPLIIHTKLGVLFPLKIMVCFTRIIWRTYGDEAVPPITVGISHHSFYSVSINIASDDCKFIAAEL